MKRTVTGSMLAWFGVLLIIGGTWGVAWAGFYLLSTALYLELLRRWIDHRWKNVEREPTMKEVVELLRPSAKRKQEEIARQKELDKMRAEVQEYADQVLDDPRPDRDRAPYDEGGPL